MGSHGPGDQQGNRFAYSAGPNASNGDRKRQAGQLTGGAATRIEVRAIQKVKNKFKGSIARPMECAPRVRLSLVAGAVLAVLGYRWCICANAGCAWKCCKRAGEGSHGRGFPSFHQVAHHCGVVDLAGIALVADVPSPSNGCIRKATRVGSSLVRYSMCG